MAGLEADTLIFVKTFPEEKHSTTLLIWKSVAIPYTKHKLDMLNMLGSPLASSPLQNLLKEGREKRGL